MEGNVTHYSSPGGTLTLQDEVTFKRKGGWFVGRSTVFFLLAVVLFLILVAVALTRHLTKQQFESTTLPADASASDEVPRRVARLSRDVAPLYYKMMLQPYLDIAPEGAEPFTLAAYLRITVRARGPVSFLQLHARGLHVSREKLKLVSYKENATSASTDPNDLEESRNITEYIDITGTWHDNTSDIFTIQLGKSLEAEKKYILDIHYTAPITDSMKGIYRISYPDKKTGKTRWLAASQLYPDHAREAFPCFDDPAFKAAFEISILRRYNMSSLSNAPHREEYSVGEGWVWDHYDRTPAVCASSVAVLVADFSKTVAPGKRPKISVWARSGRIGETLFAADGASRLLAAMNDALDVPYPLPELDLVALPDSPYDVDGALGLITFSETALFFKEATSHWASEQFSTLKSIAHGLARQWFRNLATMKEWKDVWLGEGFSSYLKYALIKKVEQNWNALDMFVVEVTQKALFLDSFSTTNPLVRESSDDQASYYVDDLSKKKGASLISMLVNSQWFEEGINLFIKKLSNQSVNHNDFWKSLEVAFTIKPTLKQQLGVYTGLKDMSSWTTLKGYPVVNVVYNGEAGEINLTQQKYSLNNSTSEDLWFIPISYTTKYGEVLENTTAQVCMKEATKNITQDKEGDDSWIMVNLQQTGFYRVNYEEKNWYLLIENLLDPMVADVFTPVTRAQLLDDSFKLALANLLNYSVPLNMTKYLIKNETSFVPWYTAIENIKLLHNFLWDLPEYSLFQEYVTALLEPTFSSLLNESVLKKTSIQTNLLFELIVGAACKFEMPACKKWALDQFTTWKNSSDNSTSLPEVVYCTAVRHGGKSEIEFVTNAYKKSVNLKEKLKLLRSLGCFSSSWHIVYLLSQTLKPSSFLSLQNVQHVWNSFLDNPEVADMAFKFLRNNWVDIITRYEDDKKILSTIIKGATDALTTDAQLQEIEEFQLRKDLTFFGKQEIEKAAERLKMKIKWRKSQMPSVISWLNFFKQEVTT